MGLMDKCIKMTRLLVAGWVLLLFIQGPVLADETVSCEDLLVGTGQFVEGASANEWWLEYRLGLSGYWIRQASCDIENTVEVIIKAYTDGGEITCHMSVESSSEWEIVDAIPIGEDNLRVVFLDVPEGSGGYSGGGLGLPGLPELPADLILTKVDPPPPPTMSVKGGGSLRFQLPGAGGTYTLPPNLFQ